MEINQGDLIKFRNNSLIFNHSIWVEVSEVSYELEGNNIEISIHGFCQDTRALSRKYFYVPIADWKILFKKLQNEKIDRIPKDCRSEIIEIESFEDL